MIKRYKCSTEISFNVPIEGKRRHIVFDTFSRGGSEYSTVDEKEQKAIESLPFFGRLIYEIKDTEPEIIPENVDTGNIPEGVPGITNCADAKAYLIERGVTMSLKTKEDIKKAAQESGIKFVDWK